eukprot:TRINITY_DN8239_c0_g1_i1.p1 TRINITY_DN8239_c0_g1~~TRINITY_DN8239_c0_g1_i1.p1  ORF type:complete len:141 (+),score=1.69 TRINITY_DN8239_c0_g1_i1:63-425(+)
MICDASMNGVKLPSNLVVFGAINPYRYRRVQGNLAGLKLNRKDLVYRVYPLPESIKQYVWNLGQLDILDEYQYIWEMVEQMVERVNKKYRAVFKKIFPLAHWYLVYLRHRYLFVSIQVAR